MRVIPAYIYFYNNCLICFVLFQKRVHFVAHTEIKEDDKDFTRVYLLSFWKMNFSLKPM